LISCIRISLLVKITYLPIQEIMIHEIRELAVQDFISVIVTQVQAQGQTGLTPSVYWVDGIAFFIGQYPSTPEIVKEQLGGRVHFASVSFVRTSYQPEKKTTIGGRDFTVKLVKAESNPDFVELAKFLNNLKPEASPTSDEKLKRA
jgi:hypothetical protein